MTDFLTRHRELIEEVEASKPIERPPAKWRNWWWSSIGGTGDTSGRPCGPGAYRATQTWPSREVAEQRALDTIRANYQWRIEEGTLKYLGAYPEGETP